MGMTLTEKILANGAEVESVQAGQFITVKPQVILGTDLTAPLSIGIFRRMKATRVTNPDQIVLVVDHFTPANDRRSAEFSRFMREFVDAQGIRNFFDVGRGGISHLLLLELGLVVPGDIVIGADSRTCTGGVLGAFAAGVGSTDMAAAWALGETWLRVPETVKVEYSGRLQPWVGGKDMILRLIADIGADGARYRAIEFCGETIDTLPLSHRTTLCNMVVEAGAKNGIIQADETTLNWIRPRAKRNVRLFRADPDAKYEEVRRYDVSNLAPQVACPSISSNVKPVEALGTIHVHQVVVGSCTNGMIDDLRVAAGILSGYTINRKVRMIVLPGTQKIYKQALEEGLVATFTDAGAVVLPAGCGPCTGAHMGVLANGETAVTTTSRNFAGSMGDPGSSVYLANPAVAAASALTGVITDPRHIKK